MVIVTSTSYLKGLLKSLKLVKPFQDQKCLINENNKKTLYISKNQQIHYSRWPFLKNLFIFAFKLTLEWNVLMKKNFFQVSLSIFYSKSHGVEF